jgi:HlyD family secretion protein
MMFRRKKFMVVFLFIFLLVVLLAAFSCSRRGGGEDPVIKVSKGNIRDVAVAIGTIEVKYETSVKSTFSGVIKKVFVEVGDVVKKGDPIFEISPTPTPFELASVRKEVEVAKIRLENAKKDIERKQTLFEKELISDKEYENMRQDLQEAQSTYNLAKQRLDLMEKGSAEVGGTALDAIIRSPVFGTILSREVSIGDPVVPLTSYQPGTELMKIARLQDLLFKGTVDEIDVGRLEEGMKAKITVGAIPDEEVYGIIDIIAPKARNKEGATVFDIEIIVTEKGNKPLRVGYSATADIIIDERNDVLTIPEGAVKFEEETTYVYLASGEKREIEIGLSDGLNIEVISGLKEGDEVKK